MSWSGSVAGSAPFQQQSYGNIQPAYGQQPPFHYGQQPQQPSYGQFQPGQTWPPTAPPQRAPDNRLPKKKGNPIITRYPPPPGYRGPAQPQGSFGTNQYQPPQPGYPQAPPGHQAYPQHGYIAPSAGQAYPPQSYGQSQPQVYPQQPYPQPQHHQWPQQGYPPNQGYSHVQGNPAMQAQAQPPSHYHGYTPQHPPVDPNHQAHGQVAGWPSQNVPIQYPPHNQPNTFIGAPILAQHMPDPNATPTQATAHLATSQSYPPPNQPTSAVSETEPNGKPQLFLAWDDWDFDFEGAIWPKSNEPVDPNLSLGVIIWHPAKQMTRALPSTFVEAEEESLRPAPEGLENGESVSMYFTAENSHEAFLDVRQTDEWENIRDDPVFVVFTNEAMERELVSLEDCIAQRDRPDEDLHITRDDEDQEMHDATPDIMDNLEQALSGSNGESKPAYVKAERPSPPSLSQEDILAKLGVTGAPKPPTDEPLPPSHFPVDRKTPTNLPEKPSVAPSIRALNPPPAPTRSQSYGSYQNPAPPLTHPRTYGSMSSAAHPIPPPPPPPIEQPRYDPWNAPQRYGAGFDGPRGSPALSEGSNHTMAGSDFDSDKPIDPTEADASAVPSFQRSDSSFSRKRSYDDADHAEGKSEHQDDHSKRKRRSQVDAAYSRR